METKLILIARVSDIEQRKALPAQKLRLERYAEQKQLPSEYHEFDEWIRTRTGITQRHIAGDDQTASDLAMYASQNAMKAAGVTSKDIDLIIVATTTPTAAA